MELSLDERTDLALRAVHALHAATDRVRARDLAPAVGTTVSYLPHVLRPLVRAGWVESRPGPTGGYRITSTATSGSLLDLIEVMEGPTEPAPCALRGGPCGGEDECAMHDAWQAARTALTEALAATPATTRPHPTDREAR